MTKGSMNIGANSVGLQSPIRTLLVDSEASLLTYKDQIGQLPEPEDDYDHHIFLRNVKFRKSGNLELYEQLIDELVHDSSKRARGPAQLAVFH